MPVAFIDPAADAATVETQAHGYRLVESAITMTLEPEGPFEPPATESVARPGTVDDLEAIEDHISLMASWSRFSVDTRFGLEAGRRLHLEWVHRAARCETGERAYFGAEDPGGITDFMTVSRTGVPIIDTVGTTASGSGASPLLVSTARQWVGNQALEAGTLASRNIAVQRFFANCGFRPSSVRYVYHRWLDEEGGANR